MKDLSGKKLLILGAYHSETEILKTARELGAYTIVTDNHTDWTQAPAKFEADEAWDISWTDMDTLKNQCEESGVDGVMAGFSERRICSAQRLSAIIGKPFYADGVDLGVICDKLRFKQACVDSGVSVPQKYVYGQPVTYPVIVKPADNGGSRGITVCHDDDQLQKAYELAMSYSDKGEVVIEQYITADEVMVYFTVHNGVAELSAMCDRYMHRFDKNITQLPVGYYFPSKYLNTFIVHNLEKYKTLSQNMGIRDGLIAFQAFAVGDDVIPFDPTYRLDGTMAYHITQHRNGINDAKMLITKSLTGSMGDDAAITAAARPAFDKPAFELPVLLTKGEIARISGMDAVKEMDEVVFIQQEIFAGDVMEKKADFSQILCRIHLCADDDGKLGAAVEKVYGLLDVRDTNGNDMIISRNTFSVGQ